MPAPRADARRATAILHGGHSADKLCAVRSIQSLGAREMATYIFKYDDAYAVQAFDRARRVGIARHFRGALKAVCLSGLLLLFGVAIYAGAPQVAVICVILICALGIGPWADYFFARRRYRKSVFYNTESRLELDSAKMIATYPTGQTESDWTPFSKAVRLDDGFLVYFDTHAPQWWPDSALREGSVADVDALFRNKLAERAGAVA